VKGGVKAYEIKVKCYGEHVGEHIGNQRKMKKNPFPPTPRKKFKGRKARLLECLGLPIGCMKFLFPKEFVTIFGLG